VSVLAVDLDNTLTTGEGSPYWVDFTDMVPDEDTITLVNEVYKQGHTVIVYTARKEDARAKTEWFLDEHGVLYHALRMEKLGYDLYVGDKAVNEAKLDDVEDITTALDNPSELS
jgi:histidinol phosphatase-like enzyme